MALPSFSMKELLEAGIHFGHQVNRWNPKMQTFLFGERNGIHIIDLQQTVPLLYSALKVLREVASGGGRVLFVGTKRQAQKIIAESAQKCGQYYVNHRWLGGTLTNWNTISNSITKLKKYEETINDEESGLTKKEMVGLTRQRDKLNLTLGGIKEMGGIPDALFVIDTNKEHIAVYEAKILGIPVIAVLDSNSDPQGIDFPIPGNDDATRAISMYCRLAAESILDGLHDSFKSSGKDSGEIKKGLSENISLNLKEDKKKKNGKTLKTNIVEDFQKTKKYKVLKNKPAEEVQAEEKPAEEVQAEEKVAEDSQKPKKDKGIKSEVAKDLEKSEKDKIDVNSDKKENNLKKEVNDKK